MTMDTIDWEIVAIEAGLGGVSPAATLAVIAEAERLAGDTDASMRKVRVALRSMTKLLQRHVP